MSEEETEPTTGPGGATSPPALSVDAEFWTDPLCAWSWAAWPHWRRLLEQRGDQLRWRLRLGGMIHDWHSFQDPFNSITRPGQMGPLWLQVRHTTGAELDERIWAEDPPHSSIPACLAIMAAALQSDDAAVRYLHRVWNAVMRRRRNVAQRSVLLELAHELAGADDHPIDADRLAADLDSEAAIAALRHDLRLARDRDIGRFPTITFRRPDRRTGRLVVGFRSFESLSTVLDQALAPDETPAPPTCDTDRRQF